MWQSTSSFRALLRGGPRRGTSKCGSRCLNLPSLALQPSICFTAHTRRTYLVLVYSKTRLSCSMRRQWKHAPQNSVFSPDVLVGTQFALAFLLQQLLCYWIEQRKSKSHYVLTAVAAELRKSYEIIFLRGVRGLFEPLSPSPCACM